MSDGRDSGDDGVLPAEAGNAGATDRRFPCQRCGAKLVFAPGTRVLRCEHCGSDNLIPQSEDDIRELDFRTHLSALARQADVAETPVVKCTACAAEIERPPQATAFACPFCGTDIVATATSKRAIKPKSLLPFRVTRAEAWASFRKWLKSLWFAPGALKRFARTDSRLSGLYVPYWTYDARTTSFYRGARGDDYYTTESYTTTENGKSVTKTRQVRRTRWTSVNGTVFNAFDDLLVLASESLPRRYAERLEPWDLARLVPYSDEYLSGFQAERYQVDLAAGFEVAREVMDDAIRENVRQDIGGDHQRIHSVKTQYDDVTFKHILLPVWLSAYRFKGRIYRFLVNARTGEVQGERPWSWIKITLLVVCLLAVAAAAVWLWLRFGQ
jgi:DNA-directed RNA polymerase subunit RPC12/RpoP